MDMEKPRLTDTMPNGILWVVIVVIIGVLISIIAARGYDAISKAANWMSPIIIFVFLACGVVAMQQLGVTSLAEF